MDTARLYRPSIPTMMHAMHNVLTFMGMKVFSGGLSRSILA